MTDLLTEEQLAIWVRQPIPDDDPFALEVMRVVSEKVLDYVGVDLVEDMSIKDQRTARRVALWVAKRTYENPRQIHADGNIGPIGGDTYAEGAALAIEFSATELAELDSIEGMSAGEGQLWVLSTALSNAVVADTIYVDGEGSDEPIPYYDSRDVGAPQ